jgi:hypothetical protein
MERVRGHMRRLRLELKGARAAPREGVLTRAHPGASLSYRLRTIVFTSDTGATPPAVTVRVTS